MLRAGHGQHLLRACLLYAQSFTGTSSSTAHKPEGGIIVSPFLQTGRGGEITSGGHTEGRGQANLALGS